MAKYLVETYYNCSFKVSHYLDEISDSELKNLEKRDDGKYEIIDVKLDNRKTKNLDKAGKVTKIIEKDNTNIDLVSEIKAKNSINNLNTKLILMKIIKDLECLIEERDIYKKQQSAIIKFTFILENMKMEK